MKKIILPLTIGALLLGACQKEDSKNQPESVSSLQKKQGIPVRVLPLQKHELEFSRKFSGEIEGSIQKSVYAAAPEYIRDIRVHIGDYVKKDQVIAMLDEKGRTPQYRQAKAQFEMAKNTLERLQKVHDAGGVSDQQLEQAQTGFQMAQAAFDAMSKVMEIRAPISGVVTDIFTKKGAVAISGRDEHPFLMISKLGHVLLKISVSAQEISLFKKGQIARIHLGEHTITGKVSKIPLAASRRDRMFHVEINFKNTKHLLKPGMYLQAEVIFSSKTALAISPEALFNDGKQNFFYAVQNNHAQKFPISTGLTTDTWIEVKGDLEENLPVIIEGATRISGNNVLVKILP